MTQPEQKISIKQDFQISKSRSVFEIWVQCFASELNSNFWGLTQPLHWFLRWGWFSPPPSTPQNLDPLTGRVKSLWKSNSLITIQLTPRPTPRIPWNYSKVQRPHWVLPRPSSRPTLDHPLAPPKTTLRPLQDNPQTNKYQHKEHPQDHPPTTPQTKNKTTQTIHKTTLRQPKTYHKTTPMTNLKSTPRPPPRTQLRPFKENFRTNWGWAVPS